MDMRLFVASLTQFEREQLQAELDNLRGDISELNADERALAKAGQKLDAILAFRNRTGAGLLESKHLVERFMQKEGKRCLTSTWNV